MIDVQNSKDERNLPVNRVGIRGIRHPLRFLDKDPTLSNHTVVGQFEMLVDLPKDQKGTHMSRFVEMLNEEELVLSIPTLPAWVNKMVSRLQAQDGYLQIQFPYFAKKIAPISKVAGLMDYDVSLKGILEKVEGELEKQSGNGLKGGMSIMKGNINEKVGDMKMRAAKERVKRSYLAK